MLKRCFAATGFRFNPRLHPFKSLILYSTASPASADGLANPLLLQFLVNSVGFTQEKAASLAAHCKTINRFTSTAKPQLVIDFLKRSGFDDTHVRDLVSAIPMILCSNPEKALKPHFRVFQELGFSGSDLGGFVSRHPLVIRRSLEADVVPALAMLKSLIGCNEELLSLLRKPRTQRLLSERALKCVPQNVLFLESYGLSKERIKWFIPRGFTLLMGSPGYFEETVRGVEEKLGIPRTSSVFMYGILGASVKSGARLKLWLEVLRDFGWSDAEISKLLGKFPQCLHVSESNLRAKLKYLMEELGFGSDYLVAHPALLSYSVENKIVPRLAVYRAMKEKQLLKKDVCFYTVVSIAESKFMQKYMLPIKDRLPDLYAYYTQTRAGSLSKSYSGLPMALLS